MNNLSIKNSLIAFLLSFCASQPVLAHAEPENMTLAAARKFAQKGEEYATKSKLNVAIAVVDFGGSLIYFQRHDGTMLGAVELAIAKAKTANAWRRPTKAFEDAVKNGKVGLISAPGVVAVEGGIPITSGGRIVGAVGVSGGTSQQDGQVAEAIVSGAELK